MNSDVINEWIESRWWIITSLLSFSIWTVELRRYHSTQANKTRTYIRWFLRIRESRLDFEYGQRLCTEMRWTSASPWDSITDIFRTFIREDRNKGLQFFFCFFQPSFNKQVRDLFSNRKIISVFAVDLWAFSWREVMSFDLVAGPLDEETRALAEKELRETEENVKNGIVALRKLLEGKSNARKQFRTSLFEIISFFSLFLIVKISRLFQFATKWFFEPLFS